MTRINEAGEPIHTIYDMGNYFHSFQNLKKEEHKQAVANMNRVYDIMSQISPKAKLYIKTLKKS